MVSWREMSICRKHKNVLRRDGINLNTPWGEYLSTLVFHVTGYHEMQCFTLKTESSDSVMNRLCVYCMEILDVIYFFFLAIFSPYSLFSLSRIYIK